MKRVDSDQPQATEAPKGLLARLLLRAEKADGGLAEVAGQTAKEYRIGYDEVLAPPDSTPTPITSYVSYGDREAAHPTDEEEDA